MIDEKAPKKPFSTLLPADLLERMTIYCKKEGHTLRWFLERVISEALKKAAK